MKKTMLILLMSILTISCSKDDSSANNGLTSNEKKIVGKWYEVGIEMAGTINDTSCEECYIEFFSSKTDDGALNGKMSQGSASYIPFVWGTAEDGNIYVMLDTILKVNLETDSKLVLDMGTIEWIYSKNPQ